MADKESIARELSKLSIEEVIDILPREVVQQIQKTDGGNVASLGNPNHATNITSVTPNSAKSRPLNAFIAFRTYYAKLFPDVQQKQASGLLTTLWNGDFFRNEWQIIALTWSFIRDEIGKGKAPLASFLPIAATAMGIAPPESYFGAFNWTARQDPDGRVSLSQNPVPQDTQIRKDGVCAFPFELLLYCTARGYAEEHGPLLARKMGKLPTMMTTISGHHFHDDADSAAEKLKFIRSAENQVAETTQQMVMNPEQISIPLVATNIIWGPGPKSYLQAGNMLFRYHYEDNHTPFHPSNPVVDLEPFGDGPGGQSTGGGPSYDISSPWGIENFVEMEGFVPGQDAMES